MSEDGSLSVLDQYTMVQKIQILFCVCQRTDATRGVPYCYGHTDQWFLLMDLPLYSMAAMSHCGHELGSSIIVRALLLGQMQKTLSSGHHDAWKGHEHG